MSLIDCLLLTLVNAVICISLPRVLSLIKLKQTNRTAPSPQTFTAVEAEPQIAILP